MGAMKQALLMMDDLDEVLNDHWERDDFARAILLDDMAVYCIQVVPDTDSKLVYECSTAQVVTGNGTVTTVEDISDVTDWLINHGFVGEE